MLTRRIIPCLDFRDGRVVKGIRFQGLVDAGDPVELAAMYEAQGADELVMLDVGASVQVRDNQAHTVSLVRNVLSIPLTVGGGVRGLDDATRLLEAGADKVSVNTAAVRDPSLLDEMAKRFGSQCTVLAIDAKSDGNGRWVCMVRSGIDAIELDAVAWAREAASRGAGEVLLTSWDRDGTKEGYDLELLRAVSGVINIPVIASGGAANVAHLIDAFGAGADAVLAASIFHYGEYTVESLKKELAKLGVEVRA